MYIIYLTCLVMVYGEAVKEGVKDEYCTDPRTMRKHAAYTEWADAYSCTRHRCQPGGRNLAIYTVGCKRVEAPESAIECEEVVEDTNMQFPYCCTRLRCLVVVRGEVWTRVLGQPWETLPAAPWSHMYKMKKPPPVDGEFMPKGGPVAGPVYELSDDKPVDRRVGVDKPVQRAAPMPGPDIVIALTTNSEKKPDSEMQSKFLSRADDERDQPNEIEAEEPPLMTEKVPEIISEERMYSADKRTSRDSKFLDPSDDEPHYRGLKDSKSHQTSLFDKGASSDEQFTNMNKRGSKQKINSVSAEEPFVTNANPKSTWARIPQDQWNAGPNTRAHDTRGYENTPAKVPDSEEKQEKPASLQHLVNAIGTRMRDIENVVQQMSEHVQPSDSLESRRADRANPHQVKDIESVGKGKQPLADNYNRFAPQQGSKYLRSVDPTTEVPMFASDNLNGYFSDASNSMLRRSMSSGPKEPPGTYMVPISTDHKKASDEPKRKHHHKKKKSKHGRRKHRKEEREKSRVKENALSMEDSNDLGSQEIYEPVRRFNGFAPRRPMRHESMADRPIAARHMKYRPIAAAHMKYRPIVHHHPTWPNLKLPLLKFMQSYGTWNRYRVL